MENETVKQNRLQNWLVKNGLQLALLAAGAILAWGAINARVSAIETKISIYPSQDWFELKFKNIDDNLIRIEAIMEKYIEIDKEGVR